MFIYSFSHLKLISVALIVNFSSSRAHLQIETTKSNKLLRNLKDAESNIVSLKNILEEQRNNLKDRFMQDHSVVSELEELLNDEIEKGHLLGEKLETEIGEKESLKTVLATVKQKLLQAEQSEFNLKQKEMKLTEILEKERQDRKSSENKLENATKTADTDNNALNELQTPSEQNERELRSEIKRLENINKKLIDQVERVVLEAHADAKAEVNKNNNKLKLLAEELDAREKMLDNKEVELEKLTSELEQEQDNLCERQRSQENIERAIYKQKSEVEQMSYELKQAKLKHAEKQQDTRKVSVEIFSVSNVRILNVRISKFAVQIEFVISKLDRLLYLGCLPRVLI